MREPYTQMYVHLVWATWDRMPLITPDLREPIYACMQAECSALQAEVLAMGGIANHVHVLIHHRVTLDIPRLLKQMKGASSHLVTHQLARDRFFKWQGAYGAFSTDKRGANALRVYILNQEQHHRDNTLMREYELDGQGE